MNREVFLSLLALDAYNRGYGQGVFLNPTDSVNGQEERNRFIGTARVTNQSDVEAGTPGVDAGFYAIAYDWNGETVISFRGTNFPNDPLSPTEAEFEAVTADFLGGWSLFTGLEYPVQIDFARDFLIAATGTGFKGVDTLFGSSNITLTGHSLGGGLAGYVGARGVLNTVAFDPIPFGSATNTQVANEAFAKTLADLGLQNATLAEYLAFFIDIESVIPITFLTAANEAPEPVGFLDFFTTLDRNLALLSPDFSVVSGYSLEGEIAALISNIQMFSPALAAILAPIISTVSPATASALVVLATDQFFEGLSDSLTDDRDGIIEIDDRRVGDLLNAVDLHSMSLLSILLYGQNQWTTDGGQAGSPWESSIRFIAPATADNDIATGLGLSSGPTGTGSSKPGSQLASMIAYSAINEGTRVFGDTGIRALFNDADDLGSALEGLPGFLKEDTRSKIGSVAAEYAGLLASRSVLSADKPDVVNGVFATGESTTIGVDFFSVYLNDERWSAYGHLQSPHSPSSKRGLIEDVIKDSLGEGYDSARADAIEAEVRLFLGQHDPDSNPVFDPYANIDQLTFSLTEGYFVKSEGNVTREIIVGTEGSDTFGNHFASDHPFVVLAGGGQDVIYGSSLSDVLIGGAGGDVLIGNGGGDLIIGGTGTDRYKLGIEGQANPLTVRIEVKQRTSDDSFGILEFSYDEITDRVIEVEQIGMSDSSDQIILLGKVGDYAKERVTIDLGGSPIQVDQDVVDASGLDRGIYYSLSSGEFRATDSSEASFFKLVNANAAKGTSFSDVLIGGSGKIGTNEGFSVLEGGAGNDLLIARGWESILDGGSGRDTLNVGANTTIRNSEAHDITAYGIRLLGGTKQWWMEGNTAYWSPFSTIQTAFPVIGSQVLSAASFFVDVATMKFASYQIDEDGGLGINFGYGLGGAAKIENYTLDLDTGLGSGGITVFQAERGTGQATSGGQNSQDQFAQFINLALKAGFGVGFTGWDPIVLDLDGDGYELTTQRNSGVYFEFDGDGFTEKTGWVRPDDGFLVLDANGNGIVDDASEFFGDETQGGFVELATHDLNSDGVINSLDAVFADLRVWRDLNSDGVTDAGELVSLAGLGITSISLAAVAPAEEINIGGNVVAFESTFTLADGTVRKAGDVVLDISHIDTRYITDMDVSAQAAALPQLRGFGNVADLHIAMSEDAALLAQVQTFDALATSDLSVLKQAAEAILYAWAGVDGVVADPIGTNGFDARKLAFLESFSGQEIAPRDPVTGAVSTSGINELEASWADTLESLTLRLVVQSSSLPAFADMTYRGDLDLIVMGSADTLKQAYSAILSGLSVDPAAALGEWEAWGELLRAIQDGSRRFDNNIVRDDFAAAQLLAAIAESGTNFDLSALAPALGISNLKIGTAESETLTQVGGGTIFSGLGDGDIARGRTGQDVYLLESGFGDVVIDDEEGGQSGDRIRFVDLDRADVTASRVGDDLVLTVIASGDTVTVLGQFADVVPLSSDVFVSNNRGVEEIQFADGTVMELPDIAIAVGDDVLVGTMHTDVFQGGAGNDLLVGGDDADLYVFNAGDGADIIRDEQTNPLLKAADMVIFGDEIAPDDLVWSRGTDLDDLLVTNAISGDSITVDGQFSYSSLGYNGQFALNSRIEIFSFRHYADVYTYKDIQQQLIASETTDGNDVTRGFGDDDFFRASAGDDVLIGMDGNDTYYFGRGYGNDTIDEQAYYIDVNVGLGGLTLEHGADTVVFSPDLDPEDVSFSRLNSDPHLTITLDSGETLTILNQFDGFQTGPLGAQWFDRIEWFEFANGTRLSWQDVLRDTTTGTDGDDSLWGDLFEDTLIGGRGNDYLSGGGYADTYIFNPGDGQDIIDDNNQFILGAGFVSVDTSADILRFGVGITSADITLQRNGDSLVLLIGSGEDRVTLQNQNDYYHTGVFGAISNSRIERVEFADGEVWTWQDLNRRAIADQTTAGDDIIEGFALADRFEASPGNDIMRGGDSGDTYVFGIGSGSDRIEESVSNQNFDDDDRVEFTAGIAQSDVTFERDGNDLIVRINGTTDQLTIAGQFNNYVGFTDNDIETFHFSDGSVITKAQIQTQLTMGTAGDDVIRGFHTNDTLIGGPGNDMLYGGDGSDTYVFNIGDGQDTIFEDVRFANIDDDDRILFGPGIAPGDVTLTRSGDDLTLSIDGTTDSITIVGQFGFTSWFSFNDVEFFEFADSTVWTKRDVSNFLMGGTSGDDVLVGTFQNDELNGLGGNDILRGGDGSDLYYFGIGYGQDTIEEDVTNANLSSFDQIIMGEGISASDLIFTRNGDALTIAIAGTTDSITVVGQFDNYIGRTDHDIEQIQFADGSIMTKEQIQSLLTVGTPGDDEIIGFHTNDVLDGGPGNDILRGLDGSDTYLFGRGSGNDIIRESVQYVNLDDEDRILFASDIAPQDIIWSRDGLDLVVGIVDTTDTITVEGGLEREGNTGYTWRDGTILTLAQVAQMSIRTTEGDDFVIGSYFAETFNGNGGNDVIRAGAGADILNGGSGDDLLAGGEGADHLTGGTGSDTLHGGGGDDTYFYNLGDGTDVIEEFSGDHNEGFGGYDRLIFGPGITPQDIGVSATNFGKDVVLTFIASGEAITLRGQTTGSRYAVEEVSFESGLVWNYDDLLTAATGGTAGDDNLFGDGGANVIFGGAGNDTITARGGDDILIGGTGNDLLHGDGGNDTYRFELGDGQDIIREFSGDFNNGSGGTDTVEFGEGIAPEDILVSQTSDGKSIILAIAGTTDQITLFDTLNSTSSRNLVEQVRFADGTLWQRAEIVSRSMTPTSGNDVFFGTPFSETLMGGAGNDTLTARNGDDILIGGTGNDLLHGDGGNDTYSFELGDGQDIIREFSGDFNNGSGGTDTVEFGEGIAPEDILVSQSSDGKSIILAIAGTADQVTLFDTLNSTNSRNLVEQVRFADGTLWQRAEIVSRSMTPTSGDDVFFGTPFSETLLGGAGNDTLTARDGDDILIGGAGNDLLHGDGGNDTYRFELGDGQDIIREFSGDHYNGSGGTDTLQFGEGIAPEDVIATRANSNKDIVFGIAGTADQVTLRETVGSTSNRSRVEFVRFADGTVWDQTQQLARAAVATSGNDTLYGSSGDDTISTLAGDDTIFGYGGNDILTGGSGNDLLNGGVGYDTAVFAGLRAAYQIVTSNGTVTVQDTDAVVDGDDGTDTIASIELLQFKNGETASVVSPIILDLDGDGIETIAASESNARFDLDGDGLADITSWIGSNDAFLFLDRDGNGTVSNVGEISFVDDLPNAATDLAGLRAFDSNGDGILDASDDRFADFGVWRDNDGDGAVDEGETASLSAIGIKSINLTGTPVNGVTNFGEVAIANTGIFTLTNGATRTFADAALTYFSAATNLPSLGATHYAFDRKASKYRIGASGGALSVAPRKARSGMDPLAGQLGANTVLTFSNGTFGIFAPVVLDLDGDGIELVSRKKSRASFDYAGDGSADDTGWIGRDDGFLVIDRNNDGLITDAAELSLAGEDEDARSGLQGLARLDSNGDGVVDSEDARFGELRIWRDRNGNGRTDAGELLLLEEAGIVAIKLSTVTPTQARVKLDRNVITATTTFVRANGTTSTAADVSLTYRPVPASAAASASLAPTLDLLGPDLFLAPRLDGVFGRAAFLPSVGELVEMLGVASSQGIAELFDRVAADGETVSAIRQSALTVTADVERQLTPRQRVFDSASISFMMFQELQQQVGPELGFEFLDVEPVAIAPALLEIALEAAQDPNAPATRFTDNSSAVEAAGTGTVASSAAEEQAPAEPVVQPAIDRPRLDPALNEVWGGPAWVASLPDARDSFIEVSTPPSHVLQPKIDLAELLAQPISNDTVPDAEIARKLAMIRQDLSSFGVRGASEGERLQQQEPESFYLYA
jgi:Ca2+-binding RTX toxin-like protein